MVSDAPHLITSNKQEQALRESFLCGLLAPGPTGKGFPPLHSEWRPFNKGFAAKTPAKGSPFAIPSGLPNKSFFGIIELLNSPIQGCFDPQKGTFLKNATR